MISAVYLRYEKDTRGLMIYEINKSLLKRGIDVSVVAPNSDDYKRFEVLHNVKVHRFSYFFPRRLQKLAYGSGIPVNLRNSLLAKIQVPFFAISFLLKALKVSRKCDIIHAQWMESGFIGVIASFLTRKPLVVTVRRISNNGPMDFFNRLVLKHADYVTFNSNFTMRKCLELATPKKYSVIHNILDTNKFRPFKTDLRKSLGIKESAKVILFLGLLVEKKGIPYLIRAFGDIAGRHKDAVLVIAGHGEAEASLKRLAAELNISERVKFIGKQEADETPALFNIADIFVLPSIIDSKGETETLGVVLLEAMACKVPVIGSRVGGIPDIIDENVGFLVEPKDSKAIAARISQLLEDKKLRTRMGKAGRKKVIDNFSSKVLTESLVEVYNSVKR